MQQADSAMYAGKREGKNRRHCFTPEIGSQVHERLTLEHLLRGAVARNEISVHYQPEFELTGNRLIRFEALARWTHPTLGQIPPRQIHSHRRRERNDLAPWAPTLWSRPAPRRSAGRSCMPYPIQVAVNVSSIQFRRKGFVEEVSAILERTGLRPELAADRSDRVGDAGRRSARGRDH